MTRIVLLALIAVLATTPALARLETLAGRIVLPDGFTPPRGAAIEVGLSVGLSERIAMQRLDLPAVSAPFRLVYDDALVPPRARIVVAAELVHEGRTLLSARRLVEGSVRAISLQLSDPLDREGPDPLRNRQWQAVSVEGAPVPAFVAPTLTFLDDGTVRGSTGCEAFTARYTATGAALEIAGIDRRRRACAARRLEIGRDVLAALRDAVAWQAAGAELRLIGRDGRTVATWRDDV